MPHTPDTVDGVHVGSEEDCDRPRQGRGDNDMCIDWSVRTEMSDGERVTIRSLQIGVSSTIAVTWSGRKSPLLVDFGAEVISVDRPS